MFEENYKYTAGTFLAEIGGQMDLWIGCSVIGLLHIIVFIVKQIYRYIRQPWLNCHKISDGNMDMAEPIDYHVPAPEVMAMAKSR